MLFYLAAYTFMIAGTFGVITVVGRTGDGAITSRDYRGLAQSNPLLSFVLTVFLLAQAGVPFTSGFFAKFYVIIASVDAGLVAARPDRHGLGGDRGVPLLAARRVDVHVDSRR